MSYRDAASTDQSRSALVFYTLVWPGLGHLLHGRHKAAALFGTWAAMTAFGIAVAPAFLLPRPLLIGELVVLTAIAVADVARGAGRSSL